MSNLLVIGAGPAGLEAAIQAAGSGLSVQVIDEFPRPGGRLLGQLYQKPDGEWWNGMDEAGNLVDRAERAGVNVECGVSVHDIERAGNSWIAHTDRGSYPARKLLLATGATERPIPIRGWTLPGVMSIGAAQVMGNVHRVKPGESCVIIGANVLSVSIAHELALCGIKVKEVILPKNDALSKASGDPVQVLASLMKLTHLAPKAVLRTLGKAGRKVSPRVAIRFFPKRGIRMFDIPMRIRTAAVEIVGESEVAGVRTVETRPDGTAIKGSERLVEADFVCIAGGLSPLSELAAVAGCRFEYHPNLGGHIPVHNERMQTNVEHLYVAGNITGVESAAVAMAQGRVAGLSIAHDMQPAGDLEPSLQAAIDGVEKARAEAMIQFQPGIAETRKRLYQEFLDGEVPAGTEDLSANG